jgi:glucosamine 6-phosphate synthetase-like amidotransferase/phosphosugar isomerase protein
LRIGKWSGKEKMCGIFGFYLKKTLPLARVFRILEKLEVHQYPEERLPLGGYGAGVALLLEDGNILVEKVGKVDGSPARKLPEMVKVARASVLIGHVRMPSPEFIKTAEHKETAQPYVVEREPNLTVASVHNGKIENYKEIRKALGGAHVFESERFELVDSEVIPHFFEETLSEKEETTEALYSFFCALEGSGAIAMLQLGEEDSFLHLLHKGKTRGLTVWTNDKNEIVFCTRKEVLRKELGNVLSRGKFKEKASIGYREEAGLVLSYPLSLT